MVCNDDEPQSCPSKGLYSQLIKKVRTTGLRAFSAVELVLHGVRRFLQGCCVRIRIKDRFSDGKVVNIFTFSIPLYIDEKLTTVFVQRFQVFFFPILFSRDVPCLESELEMWSMDEVLRIVRHAWVAKCLFTSCVLVMMRIKSGFCGWNFEKNTLLENHDD